MKTQTERVLSYMQEHGAITPLEAMNELGISRLGARVYELKQAGQPVCSKFIDVKNRFGDTCRVKCYWIGGAK